nr:aspartate aminotransferase family protein [Thalassobacillus pellis]
MTNLITDSLGEIFATHEHPYEGGKPADLEARVRKLSLFTYDGERLENLLRDIDGPLLRSNLAITHEKAAAHLHCPPLMPALGAEMVINAFNQSMDSWDQSPAATYLENEMIRWLTGKFGYPAGSDGAFTSGGTQSNYTGLLLARDSFCWKKWGWNVQKQGLPPAFNRLRILCSEHAHFTVKKSAAQLGLGEEAVVPIKVNNHHRLDIDNLDKTLQELYKADLQPFALVATCGTTDFGSIDPMREMAGLAENHGLWLHVDAAVGGALVLSEQHNEKLAGIQLADSITVDFHKLFYQPVSCGAFLVKNHSSFRFLQHHADYLNPEEDEEEGITNLVNKSVQTTRRFDALKLFFSLRIVGTKRFGEMIDKPIHLAKEVAAHLERSADIHVIDKDPELNMVVFRYIPRMLWEEKHVDQLNRDIQQELYHSGKAVIAKTTVEGRTYLKFTLLNPRTTITDIKEIIADIDTIGKNKAGRLIQ